VFNTERMDYTTEPGYGCIWGVHPNDVRLRHSSENDTVE
jgi:hypothetical protein